MISVAGRWIYVHPQKTAGTSVASALAPYADDGEVRVAGRPSDDREVAGVVTRHKHVILREYAGLLGAAFPEFAVLGGTRHPLTRAISHYFYSRRTRRAREGLPRRSPTQLWDEERFTTHVAMQPSLSDFFRLPSGEVRLPDVRVHAEDPAAAAASLARAVGAPSLALEHLNRAPADPFVASLEGSRGLAELVYGFRAEDYAVFDYDLLPG